MGILSGASGLFTQEELDAFEAMDVRLGANMSMELEEARKRRRREQAQAQQQAQDAATRAAQSRAPASIDIPPPVRGFALQCWMDRGVLGQREGKRQATRSGTGERRAECPV